MRDRTALLCGLVPAAGGASSADSAPVAPQDSIAHASVVVAGNRVAATLTNYDFIGNDLVSRASPLEYPSGSGFE